MWHQSMWGMERAKYPYYDLVLRAPDYQSPNYDAKPVASGGSLQGTPNLPQIYHNHLTQHDILVAVVHFRASHACPYACRFDTQTRHRQHGRLQILAAG